MRFKSIELEEGRFKRIISFSNRVNLVHSDKNSCGKTTLLRFMLYALGYNIPNTKRVNFNKCYVNLTIECENDVVISLIRYNDESIEVIIDSKKQTFVLPEQQNELHEIIFGTSNANILKNLLGAFYVDQEKGWTLLNRGTVIGSIHLNIEELVRGLSNRDCTDLIKKKDYLERELSKYDQIYAFAQYKESITTESVDFTLDSLEEKMNAKINQLTLEQNRLKSELKRIDQILSENKKFKQFVTNMKILIEIPGGSTVQVTEDNIVGLIDATDILIAKRKIISSEKLAVSKKLEQFEKDKYSKYEQMKFYESANQLEIFDKKILQIPLNINVIQQEISRLKKDIQDTRDQIHNITKNNNPVVTMISKNIARYETELGLDEKNSMINLFTNHLKELSGAVLHKIAFAFRLSYIKAIEKTLNIKLPIILDSPSGKEVDQANIKLMTEILQRDFKDNQIIIASIFRYDFSDVNTIEIRERLINNIN